MSEPIKNQTKAILHPMDLIPAGICKRCGGMKWDRDGKRRDLVEFRADGPRVAAAYCDSPGQWICSGCGLSLQDQEKEGVKSSGKNYLQPAEEGIDNRGKERALFNEAERKLAEVSAELEKAKGTLGALVQLAGVEILPEQLPHFVEMTFDNLRNLMVHFEERAETAEKERDKLNTLLDAAKRVAEIGEEATRWMINNTGKECAHNWNDEITAFLNRL